MRLLSCYIAGFGKFVDCSFDLSKPLVVIKGDNGWGKTTLADFIKCMLYGMDSGRAKSIETNDRIKYMPWNGNVFGGTLTFSCGGKRYRLERKFGKTQSMDEAKLYDENNMPCYDFGEKANRIGEVLFGLDGESFRKCIYIPQGEIEVGLLPDTMKNRLFALMSVSVSENGTDAVARLENAERALRAKRKPAKGKLDEIDERLEELFRKKLECESYLKTAKAASSELEKTEQAIANLSTQKKETSPKKNRQVKKACVLAVSLLLFLLGGLFLPNDKTFGVAFLCAGGITLFMRIFMRNKKAKTQDINGNADTEKQKEALLYRRAELLVQIEDCKRKADDSEVVSQEKLLSEEKARLEKRLQAIRTAKEILIKAKQNLATKYLRPVEQRCREYLRTMGAGMRSMQYSADGNVWICEKGSMREKAYYSEGEKGLVDFCTRLALIDTLFQKELPVLLLDDPFIDFDDKKTRLAKGLVVNLSKRYQVLYFTCKQERML